MVRTADVKRGWGKFFSKSCKAKEQERRTGQYKAYMNRDRMTSEERDHDAALTGMEEGWDGHKCWL